MSPVMLIYKIMTHAEWESFEQLGRFTGSPVDQADGFIHFSTASTMEETAAKHFADQENLRLIWGHDHILGAALKWEVSRGGIEFPHLYRDWMMEEVAGHAALPLVNGRHIFPAPPA